MRFACRCDISALVAAPAAIALLAFAGCGGSSPDSKTATATTPPPATTKPLDQAQRDSLATASQEFVSSASVFQAKLNGCAADTHPAACVREAARPAEAVLRKTRRTLRALTATTDGSCADSLGSVGDQLSSVAEDLGSLTQSTQKGDFKAAPRLGASVQSGLRSYAGQSTLAQTACAG